MEGENAAGDGQGVFLVGKFAVEQLRQERLLHIHLLGFQGARHGIVGAPEFLKGLAEAQKRLAVVHPLHFRAAVGGHAEDQGADMRGIEKAEQRPQRQRGDQGNDDDRVRLAQRRKGRRRGAGEADADACFSGTAAGGQHVLSQRAAPRRSLILIRPRQERLQRFHHPGVVAGGRQHAAVRRFDPGDFLLFPHLRGGGMIGDPGGEGIRRPGLRVQHFSGPVLQRQVFLFDALPERSGKLRRNKPCRERGNHQHDKIGEKITGNQPAAFSFWMLHARSLSPLFQHQYPVVRFPARA